MINRRTINCAAYTGPDRREHDVCIRDVNGRSLSGRLVLRGRWQLQKAQVERSFALLAAAYRNLSVAYLLDGNDAGHKQAHAIAARYAFAAEKHERAQSADHRRVGAWSTAKSF